MTLECLYLFDDTSKHTIRIRVNVVSCLELLSKQLCLYQHRNEEINLQIQTKIKRFNKRITRKPTRNSSYITRTL